jgi:hypothetical protein
VTKNTMEQHGAEPPRMRPMMNNALWIVQWLLALLFLFAGGMKLVLPIEAMTKQMPLPGWFLRLIGVCETLGAIGLILPGLLRIRQSLTPAGRRRAGRHYDRRDGAHDGDCRPRCCAVPVGGRAPLGVCRLRPLDVGAPRKVHWPRRSGGSSFDLTAEAA